MAGLSIYRLAQAVCLAAVLGQNVLAAPQNQAKPAKGGIAVGGSSVTATAAASITSNTATAVPTSVLESVAADAVKITTSTLANGDIVETPPKPAATPDVKSLGKVKVELDFHGKSRKDPFPKQDSMKVGKPDRERIKNAEKIAKKVSKAEKIQHVNKPLVENLSGTSLNPNAMRRGLQRRQAVNMLGPISTAAPLAMFARKTFHQVTPKSVMDTNKAIQTNKFYSNLMLGNQNSPVYTMPYEVWWSNNVNEPWGLSVDYREPEIRQFGPTQSNGASEYYINPIFIRSMHFSATEFVRGTSSMELKNLDHMSVDMTFFANKATSTTKKMEVTLVQGMGFISATYTNMTPMFQSSILFRSMVKQSSYKTGAVKYKFTLEDNSIWVLYAWTASGSSALSLQMTNNGKITARGLFSGLIQIAKLSKTTSGNSAIETIYDNASGAWAKGNTIATTISGSSGTYSFTYNRQGYGTSELLMYALPHHVASFNSVTAGKLKTALKYNSPTKGAMTAVVANAWTMAESGLPTNIGWLPVKTGDAPTYKDTYLNLQSLYSIIEMAQDMEAVTNQDSMYFSGKSLAKYAYVCLSLSDVSNDPVNALACIEKLKPAFARFAENRQIYPLVYESNTWRGIMSSAIYTTGDPNVDFGSGVYNDHHFHYSYHVQAAALIAYIDKKLTGSTTWLNNNKEYVNTLIRDACNPSALDTYFPTWRAFDWFHGHSWAKGVTDSWDGKDEESSSEDANFYYAMKMWGSITGDAAMEARGNLLLGILKRSVNAYMLLQTGNTNHPSNFIGNKVTGILFENKVHHVTYFGSAAEVHKTQGIHMLPLTAISPYMRPAAFAQQEWNVYWPGGTAVEALTDGWKGVLWANQALFDPVGSHAQFRRTDFQEAWLDGGASRSWYMSFAAMLGGASA